jgi:hypothetical protein
VLSNRHASVYNEAVQAFRNQWSVEEPEEVHDNDRDRHRRKHQQASETADEEPVGPKHFPDDVL